MGTTDSIPTLVEELTREEKLQLVHGAPDPDGQATGYVPGVERLGIPPLCLVDGPLGVRALGKPATAFPASIALAATFDPELARRQGEAMGRETRAREQDVFLGPGANLIRAPHCGRNFEYFAEDPLVSSRFATAVVEGIQSEDVIATVKHYVANNQETRRAEVSAEVDERTLRELYLPAFRAAVEADVGAVMTAYNRVNGTYMSDHGRLVGEVLKDEWGFDGFVMSDWFGTESTVGAANAGLDLEMPGVPGSELYATGADSPETDGEGDGDDGGFADLEAIDPDLAAGMPDATKGRLFGDALGDAIDAGEVPAERLDDMVTRILEAMERIGRLEETRAEGEIDTPEHRALAREIATRGTVLLENDGVLPLADDTDVALIGPHVHEAKLGGGGSSEMEPFRSSSPREGIESRAEGSVSVTRGVPGVEEPSMLELIFGDEDDADAGSGGEEPESDPTIDEAVAAASEADVAVVVVRDTATEAKDRESLALPGRQDELVEAVTEAAEETVVVLDSSGPVELPWREDVDAILEAWYPGQADGEATAAVLYGDSDPGGRLPVTFAPEETYPTADPERYPGVENVARYDEGVFVGYRHFDAEEVDPTYPFGHGLSYTEFEYGEPTLEEGEEGDGSESEREDSTVEILLENVGDRTGHEVVQVYARPPESVREEAEDAPLERPVRELVGFTSVTLEAGESRTVSIDIDEQSLARYDEAEGWVVDGGTYTLEVGRSSRDVRGETNLER